MVAAKALLPPHLKKNSKEKVDGSSNRSSYTCGHYPSYLITIYFADHIMNEMEKSKIQRGIALLKKSSSIDDQVATKLRSATIERLERHHYGKGLVSHIDN